MNNERYEVRIVDVEWLKAQVNCQARCPVRTDARAYIGAIGEGDYEEAYAFARRPNPFVFVCGRVCAHPCEDACRRGQIDKPLAICALKRFATEKHDPVLGHAYGLTAAPDGRRKAKVAILGSGPAGLSAAHDLARLGYQVTIFEAQPLAGGMLNLGLPEYRLPRELIAEEIEAIISLGIELRLNTPIGPNLTLRDLREQGYEAIFTAVGAQRSRELHIEGIDLDGVLKGIEFLLNVNLGFRVELGARVIVIGGGNVAVDVARTAARRADLAEAGDGDTSQKEVHLALDAARFAIRLGVTEVHTVCLESREEMPAYESEIEEAIKEGVILHTSLGPNRILGDNGRVVGLETVAVASVFDAQGRFDPTFVPESESVMEADTIILAIGQTPDLSFLLPEDGVELTRQGTIAVDPETLASSAPGVFAGGDVAFGPRTIIEAVADGQKGARSIDEYLSGKKRRKTIARMKVLSLYRRPLDYDAVSRQKMLTLAVNRRIGLAEVELGYDEPTAVAEAKRCLKCNIYPIFDQTKCILCGGCVDVCPENCLKMVKVSEIEGNEEVHTLVEARYGVALRCFQAEPETLGQRGTGMLKDETRCIRCGLCARRCPTGAITMQAFSYEEVEEVSA